MEHTGAEPRLSAYLHARACAKGIPLAGTFELTARCNFNCRMCYVHLTPEEQRRRGAELTADEWLAIAEQARSQGMLFLLLTGGEPLIRVDFRYLLTELKKMGLMVSINSNASLIDDDWLDFFRHEPPSRMNITLYGGCNETYERLCGRPMYDRVVRNIRALKALGIGVKLNASMTPYNVEDMDAIYAIATELGTPVQMASYMFPPVRRDEHATGSNDRFTFQEAAACSVRWDRLRCIFFHCRQQHRRKQQQTDARHADMQRQRQTYRAEHCKQRDHPNRNHVAPSKSDESRSHSSIRPVSASSQVCFSAISRASS